MGKRLNVATKFQVEYGETENFNYKTEEFKTLLEALEIDYTGETWDDEFEVDVDDFKNGLDTLKNFKELDKDTQDAIQEALKDLECDLDEVIKTFEGYLKETDPNNTFMHFQFI